MQTNQDARLGGKRSPFLRLLIIYSPLHARAFPAYLGGVNDAVDDAMSNQPYSTGN